MKGVNNIQRESIPAINVVEPERTRTERRDSLTQALNSNDKLYSDALKAIEGGNSSDKKKLIDQVVGDSENFVRIALADTIIGPGFCHCDCWA